MKRKHKLINWSYVAGFFDGEGHVALRLGPKVKGSRAFLSIDNTHRQTLDMIRTLTGGYIYQHPMQHRKKKCWALRVTHHEEVARVARAMLAYSITKHDRLVDLLDFVDNHTYTRPGRPGERS